MTHSHVPIRCYTIKPEPDLKPDFGLVRFVKLGLHSNRSRILLDVLFPPVGLIIVIDSAADPLGVHVAPNETSLVASFLEHRRDQWSQPTLAMDVISDLY